MMRCLLFAAGGRRFAVELAAVAEVVESPHLYPLPLAPPPFTGAVNFHGQIVPAVDLALLFGESAAAAPPPFLLVIAPETGNLGLTVSHVAQIAAAQITPATGEAWFAGEAAVDGDVLPLLDAAAVVAEIEKLLKNTGGQDAATRSDR